MIIIINFNAKWVHICREERERQRHMQLQQQQLNDQKKPDSQTKDGGKTDRSGKNF
jgi:hypothetical protein